MRALRVVELRVASRPSAGAGERAVAMPLAIVIALIVLLSIVATMIAVTGSSRDAKNTNARLVSNPLLETAVTRIRYGLQNELLFEDEDYTFSSARLEALVSESEGITAGADQPTVVSIAPAGQLDSTALPGGTPTFAVREPMGVGTTALHGYWQPLAVKPPVRAGSAGAVTVYIRTWIGTSGTDATPMAKPEIFRVMLRPGRFLDYQLLVNGPIVFAKGARINGPVHSNGVQDATGGVAPAGMPANTAVFSNTGVTCTNQAVVTTSPQVTGDDIAGVPGTCMQSPRSRPVINLLRVEDSFDAMRRSCARSSAFTRCFLKPRVGASLPAGLGGNDAADMRGYRVKLNGDLVTVDVYEIDWQDETPRSAGVAGFPQTFNVGTATGNLRSLYFADNVIISGTTTGRVTIAARRPVVTNADQTYVDMASGAANIYVVGDVSYDRTADPDATLGLISQGSIFLEAIGMTPAGFGKPYARPCIDTLHAAMVTVTGALRIDPRYTTETEHASFRQCNNTLDISGSVASFAPPVLYWGFSNGNHFGWKQRNYSYDKQLRKTPPPFYPITEPWQTITREPANLDCLVSNTTLQASRC